MKEKTKIKEHQPLLWTDKETNVKNYVDNNHDSKDDDLLELRQQNDSNDKDDNNDESKLTEQEDWSSIKVETSWRWQSGKGPKSKQNMVALKDLEPKETSSLLGELTTRIHFDVFLIKPGEHQGGCEETESKLSLTEKIIRIKWPWSITIDQLAE